MTSLSTWEVVHLLADFVSFVILEGNGFKNSYKEGAEVIEPLGAVGTRLWPSASGGRQVINGLEYTVHALERMAPVGLGGRGVPPSVVENAIQFGTKVAGNLPGTVMHVFENVAVVTNQAVNVVITLIKTGHSYGYHND